MNNIIVNGSLRFVDQELKKSNNTSKRRSRPKSPYPVVVTQTTDGDAPRALSGSNVTFSINKRFSAKLFPQTRPALEDSQQASSEEINDNNPPCQENWSDTSSSHSAVSISSSSSTAALKLHHATQFSKLLPCNYPVHEASSRNLRKTLSRKLGIHNLIGTTSDRLSRYPPGSSFKYRSEEVFNDHIDVTESIAQTIKVPMKSCADQSLSGAKTPSVIFPQSQQKRAVPQGAILEVVQLNLQEKILSKIMNQAIKHAQLDSTGVKGKKKMDVVDTEQEADELDRKLEVTRELMKRIRVTLDDRSYQILCTFGNKGKDDSVDEKYAIVWDILLMLMHAFRDILAKFDRAYRPTGSPVTDQELIEQMDQYLHDRERLTLSHSTMAVEEVLKNLDIVKHKIELGARAGMEDILDNVISK